MPMTRTDAASFLAGQLGSLLADAGIGTEDMTGELKEPIDEALLMTGAAFGDLPTASVADADALGFTRVLYWAGLKRLLNEHALRVDISQGDPGVSKRESQSAAALEKRLAQAWAEAAPFVVVGAENSWQAPARLGLDTYNKPYLGELGNLVQNPWFWE
jgi:hypothetical protein